MAPLARILGPSITPKTKLFASIAAPTDAQGMKTNRIIKEISKTPTMSHPKSDVEMSDDNSTILVKVIYDPITGAPPSEDTLRQAFNNRLIRRSDQKNKKDAIIVNLLEQNSQTKLPIRLQQSVFNRSTVSFQQQQRSSIRIPFHSSQPQLTQQKNPFSSSLKTSQTPLSLPPLPPIRRASHLSSQNENTHLIQATKPLLDRQEFQTRRLSRLPNQTIKPLRANRSYSTGFFFIYLSIYNSFLLSAHKNLSTTNYFFK
jgi:hypothetical protein